MARTQFQNLYQANRLPAYASNHQGGWDPGRSLYNVTGPTMRGARGWLGKARAGTDLLKISFVGDSSSSGVVNVGTGDFVSQLREVFGKAGFTVGERVTTNNNHASGSLDSRFTNSGWGFSNSVTGLATASVNTATLAYLSIAVGTVVDIVCTSGSTFSYTIDGGSTVNVTPSGSTVRTLTTTGLANTTHTVVLTGPSSGSASVASVGVRSASGVVLMNAGLYGAYTTDWLGTNANNDPINQVIAQTPGIAFVELGGNDILTLPVATFQTNLNSIVSKLKAAGATVFLTATQAGSLRGPTAEYLNAIYNVADTQNVLLLDFYDSMDVPAADLRTDVSHFNNAGHAIKCAAVADMLQIARTNR